MATLRFEAPLGKREKTVSQVVALGGFVVAPTMLGIVLMLGLNNPWFVFLPVPFLLTLGALTLLAPRAFLITEEALLISNWILPKVVYITDISGAGQAPDAIGGLMIGGSFGFLGKWGLFWNRDMGKHFLFCTDSNRMLFLARRNAPPIVLSPDDPDRFLAEVKKRQEQLHQQQ